MVFCPSRKAMCDVRLVQLFVYFVKVVKLCAMISKVAKLCVMLCPSSKALFKCQNCARCCVQVAKLCVM